MPSLSDRLKWNEAERQACISIEATARVAVSDILNGWVSENDIETQLREQIRYSYIAGASVAKQSAVQSAGLPGWDPETYMDRAYLRSLYSDVRRNLERYESGTLTHRQLVLRVQHSAGVAVHQGRTDQMISAYAELEESGFKLRKYWVANFVNNVPCETCTKLHGTSVGLHETFPVATGEPGVYRQLQGPPRHPNCKCSIFIYMTSLDNPTAEPNFERPADSPQMMSTSDVKKMPRGLFASIRATLKAIVAFFRRRR